MSHDQVISLVKIVVTKAQAIEAKESGGRTVEVETVLSLRNDGDGVVGVSPRQFTYELFPRGVDGSLGTPQMFFGIRDPDLSDAQSLAPGESITLSAPLEGHTVPIDTSGNYVLVVTHVDDKDITSRSDVSFS